MIGVVRVARVARGKGCWVEPDRAPQEVPRPRSGARSTTCTRKLLVPGPGGWGCEEGDPLAGRGLKEVGFCQGEGCGAVGHSRSKLMTGSAREWGARVRTRKPSVQDLALEPASQSREHQHGSLPAPCLGAPEMAQPDTGREPGPWPGPALSGHVSSCSKEDQGVRRDLGAVLGPELRQRGGSRKEEGSRCLKAGLTSAGPGLQDLVGQLLSPGSSLAGWIPAPHQVLLERVARVQVAVQEGRRGWRRRWKGGHGLE